MSVDDIRDAIRNFEESGAESLVLEIRRLGALDFESRRWADAFEKAYATNRAWYMKFKELNALLLEARIQQKGVIEATAALNSHGILEYDVWCAGGWMTLVDGERA
jgi:hypothetical protein